MGKHVLSAQCSSTGAAFSAQCFTMLKISWAFSAQCRPSYGVLNTLNELASALGNDANFSTTVTTALSNRVQTTGDETIAGNKTFSSTIIGNINGESEKTNTIKNASTAPDSNTSGTAGEIRYDSNFLYICTGTGTGLWKKVALQNIP